MKFKTMKQFTVVLFMFIGLALFAQDTAYVIFTSSETKTDYSSENYADIDYDKTVFRDVPHMFVLRNRTEKFFRTFYYENEIGYPESPVVMKPVSYLETVEYYDWDLMCPNMTYSEAKALMDDWWEKQVYFIDRREINDGMIKMYPVREMRSNY